MVSGQNHSLLKIGHEKSRKIVTGKKLRYEKKPDWLKEKKVQLAKSPELCICV